MQQSYILFLLCIYVVYVYLYIYRQIFFTLFPFLILFFHEIQHILSFIVENFLCKNFQTFNYFVRTLMAFFIHSTYKIEKDSGIHIVGIFFFSCIYNTCTLYMYTLLFTKNLFRFVFVLFFLTFCFKKEKHSFLVIY